MLQSLPRAFQTINLLFQTVAPQVFKWIKQFCQFISQICFCGSKFVAGSGIPKGPKFFVQSHKTLSPQSMLIGPTDRFFSGNISYKNNCETIPTYISCVSNSSELKFGLLFETFNQNLDDFPLYFVCIFVSLSTNFKSNFRMY